MAKLSISVPDDLVEDLRGLAGGNVSGFVTVAIRHEVDRRQLFSFLNELDEELGPVDDEEVAYFERVLAQSAQEEPPSPTRRAGKVANRRQAS